MTGSGHRRPPLFPAGTSAATAAELDGALRAAFGPDDPRRSRSWSVAAITDANRGRGVFSRVLRVDLIWDGPGPDGRRPEVVVVKLPVAGPNGAAARATGAYQREVDAYRHLVPQLPIRTPTVHSAEMAADGARLVLEDLGRLRFVDQQAGLGAEDAARVAAALRRLHQWGEGPGAEVLNALDIRRATPARFSPEALATGLDALATTWSDVVPPETRAALATVVARRSELVDAFAAADPPTLCHGDPRADNLAFADDDEPVFYDWQQMAIQFGAADLAWLAATSIETDLRRQIDHDLVAAYGADLDAYRLGLVLPGLAVLLLAQRQVDGPRTRAFVATSLVRIATAVADLDVAGLVA